MDYTNLINEALNFISNTVLLVPPIAGAEVVKETTKKLYNWMFEKLKKDGKENDLAAFSENSNDNNSKARLIKSMQGILVDSENSNEFISLIENVRTVIKSNNVQFTLDGENQIVQKIVDQSTNKELNNTQYSDTGINSINQTF